MGLESQQMQGTNGRFRRILIFFGLTILQIIVVDLFLTRIPILGGQIRATRPRRLRNFARNFRQLAIEMGGVMIKLGQFLSSRVDVLPAEITDELLDLQDEVPPVPTPLMFTILAQELGDWRSKFAAIDEEPLAAASLGQAYRAWLPAADGSAELGETVVIKVQRPNIEETVRIDLAALQVVAHWLMRYRPIARRANIPQLMDEFAVTLWDELDYESEADNAERFQAMYAENPAIQIPHVYRELSTKRVIVLEDVTAIKLTDSAAMEAAGIDPHRVADLLLDVYFRQVFIEAFFHADPHPGNLFVKPMGENKGDGKRPFRLVFIDFGMVGHVPDLVGENLSIVLISVTQRDSYRLTQAYQNLGFFLPGADLERITEAQAVLLDRIWGRNLLELANPDPDELHELGKEFRDVFYEFPFQIPQDFIYLGRAIGMVSGLVSLLNPEINPWYHLEKFGEELVKSQGGRAWSKTLVLEVLRPYLQIPSQLTSVLTNLERGTLKVHTVADHETTRRLNRMDKKIGQLSWSILGAAGIISATLVYLKKKE